MDSIPSDIAKKLLNRDFANLVKRVQAGGKISRTERAMLQSMTATTLELRERGEPAHLHRDEHREFLPRDAGGGAVSDDAGVDARMVGHGAAAG